MLKDATHVLEKYYAKLSLAQTRKRDAPETWEGDYSGQSEAGAEVISLLKEITKNTEAEQKETDEKEESAQKEHDDSMADLKEEEGTLQETLVKLKKSLADAELSLKDKKNELVVTKKEKKATEAYLADIKPGCDFYTEHFDTREKNRADETDALKQ